MKDDTPNRVLTAVFEAICGVIFLAGAWLAVGDDNWGWTRYNLLAIYLAAMSAMFMVGSLWSIIHAWIGRKR